VIEYAIVLLTNIEDVKKVNRVKVRFGTEVYSINGEIARAFVESTNHAYHDYPHHNCLEHGLEFVPPELRPIFEYLYETLREVCPWNEQ